MPGKPAMKIGITGAGGLLGGSLLKRLETVSEMEIRALVRQTVTAGQPNVHWVSGDLCSPEACAAFVEGLDVILHFAHKNSPLTSDSDWVRDAQLSLLPTLNLLKAIERAGRRPQVVYPSSGGAVYGLSPSQIPFREDSPCNPENSYGVQKLAVEHYLRIMAERRMLTATVLRIGNAYGWILPPDRLQGFIGTAVHRILHGQAIRIVGNPRNIRDYVHVDDIGEAVLRSTRRRAGFEVINIGTGVGTSVSDILEILRRLAAHPLETSVEHVPGDERLPPWCVLDIARAADVLGWKPAISLEEGIARMLVAGDNR